MVTEIEQNLPSLIGPTGGGGVNNSNMSLECLAQCGRLDFGVPISADQPMNRSHGVAEKPIGAGVIDDGVEMSVQLDVLIQIIVVCAGLHLARQCTKGGSLRF